MELSDVGTISNTSVVASLISTFEFAGYTLETPLVITVTSSIQ
jgi:hypothetical protein